MKEQLISDLHYRLLARVDCDNSKPGGGLDAAVGPESQAHQQESQQRDGGGHSGSGGDVTAEAGFFHPRTGPIRKPQVKEVGRTGLAFAPRFRRWFGGGFRRYFPGFQFLDISDDTEFSQRCLDRFGVFFLHQ